MIKPVVSCPPIPIADTLPGHLPEVFRLLVLSDLHLGIKPAASDRVVTNDRLLDRIDYAVLLGDQVGSYGTNREYGLLDHFLARLEKPYWAVNGNHEFYFEVIEESDPRRGRVWREESPEAKLAQLSKFKRFFGFKQLWHAEHTDLGSFLFLGLDTVGEHKVEGISAEQRYFLREQLLLAADRPTYAFCHAPLMLDRRLDMDYYDTQRTACVELGREFQQLLAERTSPLLWFSGHIHLRPDHYLFAPYQLAPQVWQIHCPDSWGYSRWKREHLVPQRHDGLFSRYLEIRATGVAMVTHDHNTGADTGRCEIGFDVRL